MVLIGQRVMSRVQAFKIIGILLCATRHNKTLKLTLWPTFRFGVPSALYPKTPLRPKCNLAKRYMPLEASSDIK